jgi:hypothetical protein
MKSGFLVACTLVILAMTVFFATASRAAANPLTGDYFGTASIDSPAGLGNIDLAFHLELDAAGNMIPDSYVMLDKTVLFPVVAPKVNSQDVGPRVSGTFAANQFSLTTQLFPTILHDIDDNKTITHQVSLTSTAITEGGNSITGTYSEIMTGYFVNPINVVGTFTLVHPVSVTSGFPVCQDYLAPRGELTLDEIRAGGKDSKVVEFEDLSCAMKYQQNPGLGLTVSDATMAAAIKEYEGHLQ